MRWLLKDIICVVGLLVMATLTFINLAGMAFNIQAIKEGIVVWGLTWFELLSIFFIVVFWIVALRLISKINKYEKPKIDLWVRRMGGKLLSEPQKYPVRLSWYFDVNIANTSHTESIGIRSILLIRGSHKKMTLRPHIGQVNSSENIVGEISDTFHLGPDESISGRIVFMQEIKTEEEHHEMPKREYIAEEMLMIDNQGKEYRWPLSLDRPDVLTWR